MEAIFPRLPVQYCKEVHRRPNSVPPAKAGSIPGGLFFSDPSNALGMATTWLSDRPSWECWLTTMRSPLLRACIGSFKWRCPGGSLPVRLATRTAMVVKLLRDGWREKRNKIVIRGTEPSRPTSIDENQTTYAVLFVRVGLSSLIRS